MPRTAVGSRAGDNFDPAATVAPVFLREIRVGSMTGIDGDRRGHHHDVKGEHAADPRPGDRAVARGEAFNQSAHGCPVRDVRLWIQRTSVRGPRDQRSFNSSPGLIAVFHALRRLLVPRHPPHALSSLAALFPPSERVATPGREERSPDY
jgi:hypothetical protein